MLTTACCSVVRLGLGLALRLDLRLVSGWSVVTHMYLYYFQLSLSLFLLPSRLAVTVCSDRRPYIVTLAMSLRLTN